MPGNYPTNPALIEALTALRTDQGLTNKRLAALLGIKGVSETFLSKYINDNLDRHIPEFESVAFDIVRSIRERMSFANSIYQTSVVRKMGNVLNLIRKTGDFAVLTSKAGNGKTSAVHQFAADNPSCVCINLNATTRDAGKVEGLIFRATDHREWRGQTSRFDFLVQRFKGTGRLLIVDNAQRLTMSGRQLIFDFADDADCPVALVGNPEMIDNIRGNDQQFSRIGIYGNYELEDKELPQASLHVARQFSDDATADAVSDLVAHIAAHDGRLRAVKKTIVLAQQLREESAKLADDPRAAVRAAHARLIRDYQLPID
jgi:DNA transposition AAA+ family ATPase